MVLVEEGEVSGVGGGVAEGEGVEDGRLEGVVEFGGAGRRGAGLRWPSAAGGVDAVVGRLADRGVVERLVETCYFCPFRFDCSGRFLMFY